ncbi:MAG: ABC transporter ATP-binding protein [Proteobacteria bacterium]|nr:ABC transporter ATP-binding protein [Cystobacterineae bacterium]MCL2259009.1 ABC transporter ATP-binding protein [Cystobacterineae bacterium]MCL2314866.1 ABC transporter ATP-binding protein [Pseudomonadota bacterium]
MADKKMEDKETAVLRLEGLTKCYGTFCALKDVNLNIHHGEIFALLGPNGAGKTTLIGCIGGLAKKTAGKAYVFGLDLDKHAQKLRYEMGFVHQELNFDPFFTPREILSFQMGYYGMRKDAARIEELLKIFSLSNKADVQMRALSGGMRRRMMIAKALVHSPKLLFLDEPTAGVDMELRQDLWNYVKHLRENGTTIVLTTHYLEEAEALADRVGLLSQGRLVVVEEKNHLISNLGTKQLHIRLASPSTQEKLQKTLPHVITTLSENGMQLTIFQKNGQPNFVEILATLSSQLPIEDIQTQNPRLEDVIYSILHADNANTDHAEHTHAHTPPKP